MTHSCGSFPSCAQTGIAREKKARRANQHREKKRANIVETKRSEGNNRGIIVNFMVKSTNGEIKIGASAVRRQV